MIEKIVSGGQTGTDRAGLDIAIDLGIPCGGWCPKERLSEDGKIPDIYPLTETTSKDYRKRTEMNIVDSDATLIITEGKPTGGTALTVRLAKKHSKPCLIVDLLSDTDVKDVSDWLNAKQVHVLNVAGPRESKHPGIQKRGKYFLLKAFSEKKSS